ncbi:GNAT family N-acetyltransferase [Myroides sp. DW712]|uniref:GNAT family N-acetyltransferase n=1 Tax=Myroides sp. DW712 TaxID=3389800 RepID=UPI003978412D
MTTIIETDRLIIREITKEDAQGIYNLDSDERVVKYVGSMVITSLEEANEIIEFIQKQYSDFGIGRWAIIEKDTGEFIGWCGFKLVENGLNGLREYLDLAYRFRFDAWGKGYATEATQACLAYAEQNFQHHPVFAVSEVENESSKRVLGKIGFHAAYTFDLDGVDHYWYMRE